MGNAVTPVKLLASLSRLGDRVEAAELTLNTPGAEELRNIRVQVLYQLADYVIPRLVQLDAPMVVVVGGSTGAGKSTLVNSLLRERLSNAGVLRPTTRAPVLIHHPQDAKWFTDGHLLPELIHGTEDDPVHRIRVVESATMVPGLVIIDAPDINSIDRTNRALAAQLLKAADLWLFVSSAARYSDAVPWEFLTEALDRDAAVAVVLDRTSPEAVNEVRRHLARIMTARGMSDSPLFTVPEAALDKDGLLPEDIVAPIWDWLESLAQDTETRQLLVKQTLDGAVRQLVFAAYELADMIEAQLAAASVLHTEVEEAYAKARHDFDSTLELGGFFSGQVLSKWQELALEFDLEKLVKDPQGRVTEKSRAPSTTDATDAITNALTAGLVDLAIESASLAAQAWRELPFGAPLLTGQLETAGPGADQHAGQVVQAWLDALRDSTRSATEDKKLTPVFQSLGVNGLATALMIWTLAGSKSSLPLAQLAHDVLHLVLGSERTTSLFDDARVALSAAVDHFLVAEQNRYLDLVPSPEVIAEMQVGLRDAARDAEYARLVDLDEENSA